ncbi:GNAT family N-acetyltransferase [Marivita sp. S2033]|uniref:GNAT family N-acetyltransferase n=1 Tax=Marivita sp. S2033 TaxID=3373187 RepID=UPI0039819C7E
MDLDIRLDFVETAPDLVELTGILTEYYAQILERLMAVGGPRFSVSEHVDASIAEIDQFLPPNGAIVLARDRSGFLLGCAFVRMLDADRAELKRLYVRDLARGMGLGRKLIEMRIDKAREMGAKTVYSDTVRGNSSMLALYDRLGFSETPIYDGDGNAPTLAPYLVFRKLELDSPGE